MPLTTERTVEVSEKHTGTSGRSSGRPVRESGREEVTAISLEDLAELAAERLTSEQLHAIAARVAAAELVAERADVPGAMREESHDLAAEVRFDLRGTVRRLVRRWGAGPAGMGIDGDLLAPWLLPQLVRAGAAEHDVVEALRAEIGWCPRTEDERLEAVARGMLDDGFSPDVVKAALRSIDHRDEEREAA